MNAVYLNLNKLKVFFILVKKGYSNIIINFLIKNGVAFSTTFFAEGIKKNYVYDILGEEKNREVVFAIISDDKYQIIFNFLKSRFAFEKSMKGMLLNFDILSSIICIYEKK